MTDLEILSDFEWKLRLIWICDYVMIPIIIISLLCGIIRNIRLIYRNRISKVSEFLQFFITVIATIVSWIYLRRDILNQFLLYLNTLHIIVVMIIIYLSPNYEVRYFYYFRIFQKYRETKCIICYENYTYLDKIVVLECNHYYHQNCLYQWFDTEESIKEIPSCPMCKKKVDL